MWWLLVPVIGAVVAAVTASDDDDEAKAAASRARSQAREAEEQAIARRKQESLQKRRAQLVVDVDGQLNDLFISHPTVLERTGEVAKGVSFDSLHAFAIKKVPSKPQTMLKHLEAIAPGTSFSPMWKKQASQARGLQEEISDLHSLKKNLLG